MARTQQEQFEAFEALRAWDEKWCASLNFRGCCDAHPSLQAEASDG